jgi:hypothetical protein
MFREIYRDSRAHEDTSSSLATILSCGSSNNCGQPAVVVVNGLVKQLLV